jgi:small subunit ribosomal protein S24e
MQVQITSQTENPLLKRREILFILYHEEEGRTPSRPEIKKAVAGVLQTNPDLVFVRKLMTKTGTHEASGIANVYDSLEQAKQVEPDHIVDRNIPPEKLKEEGKE